jgi:trafficking protein particle complex subunit 5
LEIDSLADLLPLIFPVNSLLLAVRLFQSPLTLGALSVDAYLSGIIAGILEGTGFSARVTAHSVALEEGEASPNPASTSSALPPRKEKTVFLVKFTPSVLSRDANMM